MALTDLHIRESLHRVVFQTAPSVLRALEAEEAEAVRTRTVRMADGETRHEVRFPRRLAPAGLTYVRTYGGPAFNLRRSHAPMPVEGAYIEGASIPIWLPATRAELVVRLPPDCVPTRAMGFLWPMALQPDPDLPRFSEKLPFVTPSMRTTAQGTTLRVVLEEPLMGLRLALAWEPPE